MAAIAKPLVAGVGQDNGQCIFEALRVSLEEVSERKEVSLYLPVLLFVGCCSRTDKEALGGGSN